MSDVKLGTISHINERGFGFIKDPSAPQGTNDIFFHASSVRGEARFMDLQVNDEVEFSNLQSDDKGVSAGKVVLKLKEVTD